MVVTDTIPLAEDAQQNCARFDNSASIACSPKPSGGLATRNQLARCSGNPASTKTPSLTGRREMMDPLTDLFRFAGQPGTLKESNKQEIIQCLTKSN